jgi:hypothetical protein
MSEKSNFGIQSHIKESRKIKQKSKEHNVVLEGNPGENVYQINDYVGQVLSEMLVKNKVWVDVQMKKGLEMLPDVSEAELQGAFRFGLSSFFKQQYKLFTADQKTRERVIPEILKNDDYIKQQIAAYTFDFIQVLKSAKDDGMTSREVLETAQLAHRHNPDAITSLTARYPDVEKSVIRRALIGYSRNPEAFIDNFIAEVKNLKSKYPAVAEWIINTAALKNQRTRKNPNGPESFIDSYIERIAKLYKKYGTVDPGVLRNIAVHNTKNPDEFVDTYIKKKDELVSKYPDLNYRIIKHSLLHRPSNPESFITEYLSGKTPLVAEEGDEEMEDAKP